MRDMEAFNKHFDEAHLTSQHGQYRYVCDLCDRTAFFTEQEFVAHALSIHSSRHPVHCKLCEFGCDTQAVMKVHLKTVHHLKPSASTCFCCKMSERSRLRSCEEVRNHVVQAFRKSDPHRKLQGNYDSAPRASPLSFAGSPELIYDEVVQQHHESTGSGESNVNSNESSTPLQVINSTNIKASGPSQFFPQHRCKQSIYSTIEERPNEEDSECARSSACFDLLRSAEGGLLKNSDIESLLGKIERLTFFDESPTRSRCESESDDPLHRRPTPTAHLPHKAATATSKSSGAAGPHDSFHDSHTRASSLHSMGLGATATNNNDPLRQS